MSKVSFDAEPLSFDASLVYFLGGVAMTWEEYKTWEDTGRQLDYEDHMIRRSEEGRSPF